MIINNYLINPIGKLVASGAGVATISSRNDCEWAIGASATAAPVAVVWGFVEARKDKPINLEAGEYLYVRGDHVVARGDFIVGIHAANPAAGAI